MRLLEMLSLVVWTLIFFSAIGLRTFWTGFSAVFLIVMSRAGLLLRKSFGAASETTPVRCSTVGCRNSVASLIGIGL